MSSRDQIYRKAYIQYEKGELNEAAELFSKALDCFIASWEDEKKIKAHYYRGRAFYRIGIQCEKNQMFEDSKEKFENALNDFNKVTGLISEIRGNKDAEVNYCKVCSNYTLGILYKRKQMLKESKEKFDDVIKSLKDTSSCNPYKENGKLWFYRGIASSNQGNQIHNRQSLEYFKKAASYDYYDTYILKNLIPEILNSEKTEQEDNLTNIIFLYYLKRYSKIIRDYSYDSLHKDCLNNLIKDYEYEGAYYCALSHYEFKDFERSFKIFEKLTKINSNKNSEKFRPISWYYKGLILSELKNGRNLGDFSKWLFERYEISVAEEDQKKFENGVEKDIRLITENYKNSKNEEERQKFTKFIYSKLELDYCKWLEYLERCMSVEATGDYISKRHTPARYFRAKTYEENGEKLKAQEAFQKVIDIEANRSFEESLKIYNEIIKKSQNSSLYYEKALVLDELKRYKEAIESLDEFIKNKPRDAKAWLKKGTILFKIAEDEGIKTTSEEPKTEDKNEKRTCEKEITKIEAAKNALEKSIGYFKILIDENPGNPDHWYNRGTAHSSLAEVLTKMRDYQGSLNEYEEAVKAFDNATTLNPDFALAWNNKGNAYLKLKKYNKAIEAFEKAFEINPNYYLALHNKGDALYSLGKYDEAIKVYEQVIKQGNDNSINTISYKSYNNKGLAYYKLEKYDEAIKAFDEAVKINPTFTDALTNRGLVFYKLEIFSKAKEAFKDALKLEQGDPRASNNLAVVLSTEGELDQAKRIFENIVEENPDFTLASANLAELFLNSGGIERASEKINNIPKDDRNPDSSMGYVHFLDGRIKIEDTESKEKKYSEAAKSFEKAASFNVEDPTSLLWLVYAKYLCQKFETYEKANSSEESKTGEIPSKTEEICSNELSNSIVSDLGKVLNFCNTPAIKKNPLLRLPDLKPLWETILAIIFLYGLLYLFENLKLYNISNIQILRDFELVAIGLIISLILFTQKLLWPVAIAIISLLGLCQLNSRVIVILLLIVTLITTLIKLFDRRFTWPIVVAAFIALFGPCHFFNDQMRRYLSFPNVLTLLLLVFLCVVLVLIITYELNDHIKSKIPNVPTRIKMKSKGYHIKLTNHKEIKAYTLYLLGYFYFKLQDYTTAKEKLQECINLRPDDKTKKAARELLDNIWKHKIKPSFWTYWFNSPVNTWKRRAFGTFVILGILLILFVHAENPQPVALKETSPNSPRNFIPNQINIYPYIISYYPVNNTTSNFTNFPSDENSANNGDNNNNNNGNDNTTWNILTPSRVNVYPDIPDNYFDIILLLILFLILISPSIRIAETIKIALKKGADVSLDLGPIAAPPEFNFELSPSLMQDVIKRLDENL